MTAVIQRSFASGEIAPALYSRCDQVRYQTGCRQLRNMFVMRHGGATSRPGTEFVCETLSRLSAGNPLPMRLFPFVFNDSQTYVLEVGTTQKIASNTKYIRVHKNGGSVLNSVLTITGITQANPGVVTSAAHGLANGDEVYITAVVGMTQVNTKRYLVNNVSANTFELWNYDGNKVDTTGYTAYSSGGSAQKVVKIAGLWSSTVSMPYMQTDQAADILTVVSSSAAITEISRSSDTAWSTATFTAFTPSQAAPTALTGSTGYVGTGTRWFWGVTAVSALTGEESILSAFLSSSTAPSTGTPITFTWTAPAGTIAFYNVYVFNGAWGFYGTVQSASFTDYGVGSIDFTNPPPTINDYATPKASTGGVYPGVVGSAQQRKIYSGITDYPGKIWGSRSGLRGNFAQKSASFADDPIAFTLVGRHVNEVRHILDIGRPIVFTSGGVFSLEGNGSGTLIPTEPNPKQQSNHGAAAYPQPLIIDGSAVYVQARGGTVLDLMFDFTSDSYKGNELSIFSSHLLEGHTIFDWAYQEIPHRVLWMVRDDGVLLSMTYVKEQQIVGWARHDTDGKYINVCVVPESNEDRPYFIVERTIGGIKKQYIERMASRYVTDDLLPGYIGADCAKTYDGRANSLFISGTIGTHWTMTLSGGTLWDNSETLTLTASGSYFVSGDVGSDIQLTAADGSIVRFTIGTYSSGTVVTGTVDILVPADLRAAATTNWAKAVKTFSGLDHLEGKSVSILGDGNVVANPNDSSLTAVTVSSGSITLTQAYAQVTVGLPYICDLETLDIDSAQGETLADKAKLISRVSIHMEKTRGVYVGPQPPTSDTTNPKENLSLMRHLTPDTLQTGVKDINIPPRWNMNGRVFIRQLDPLPITILAVSPTGLVPFKQGGS